MISQSYMTEAPAGYQRTKEPVWKPYNDERREKALYFGEESKMSPPIYYVTARLEFPLKVVFPSQNNGQCTARICLHAVISDNPTFGIATDQV